MSEIVLRQKIHKDEYTDFVSKMYDVPPSEESVTKIQNNIDLPDEWNIGLIFGESGSGKSTLLGKFKTFKENSWDTEKSIISSLGAKSPDLAAEVLCAVGFSTIPDWLRSYNNLSTGQKFRADLAKYIINAPGQDLIVVDEFSSVVDRSVAKSSSFSLQKYIRRSNKKIILASCHNDIIDWLQPDWVYNPTEAMTHVFERGSLHRPEIKLEVFRAKHEAWELFKQHHYLTAEVNRSCRVFLCYWNGKPVAINCVINLPHPKLKKAWRESRLVVLPDYQGLSIGVRLSDYTGSLIVAQGGRYYSRTTHPTMIAYRNKNKNLWRFAGKGKSSPQGGTSGIGKDNYHTHRYLHSHEYIGPPASAEESFVFWEKP